MKKQFGIFRQLMFSTLIISYITLPSYAQEEYKDPKNKDLKELYPGGSFYEVQNYSQPKKSKQPKNIILMIGDGMGVAQIYSGMTANGGHLF